MTESLYTELEKHQKLCDLCRYFTNHADYLATAERLLSEGITEPTYARLRMPRGRVEIVTPWMSIANTLFLAESHQNDPKHTVEYGSPSTMESVHFWVLNGDLQIRDSNVNVMRWVHEFPIAHHSVDVIRDTFQWYEYQGSITFTLETLRQLQKLDNDACFDWLLEYKNKAVRNGNT